MNKLYRPRNQWAWLEREKWQGAAGAPGDDMMAEINALPQVLRQLSADEVLVRGMYLMNDQPMHENPYWVRKFDAEAVSQTVPMVPGRPVLVNHSTDGLDGLPIGRFFRAELDHRPDGSTWMAALFFMLKNRHQWVADAIDSGIISENSPTLEFDRAYCSVCGETDLDCEHVPGKLYDGKKCYMVLTGVVDFWEGSIVWAGQQKNTGFYVAAGRDPGSVMTMDEYMASLSKKRDEREAARVLDGLAPRPGASEWERFMRVGGTEH